MAVWLEVWFISLEGRLGAGNSKREKLNQNWKQAKPRCIYFINSFNKLNQLSLIYSLLAALSASHLSFQLGGGKQTDTEVCFSLSGSHSFFSCSVSIIPQERSEKKSGLRRNETRYRFISQHRMKKIELDHHVGENK